MGEEIDLRETTEHIRDEILRQHPETDIHGPLAFVRGNHAFNIVDLAKAALGMRVTRWEWERGDEPTFGPNDEPPP